jgi:hypothetical protein
VKKKTKPVKKAKAKVKPEPAPTQPRQTGLDPRIGELVRYYFEGWRFGYLDKVEGKRASIRPIAPGVVRNIRVPLEEIELAQDWKERR